MPSSRELKDRIKSIKDTKKITKAMYLISSTKMRKAKESLDNTRPYFEYLRVEIKRVIRSLKTVDSKYIYPEDMKEFKNGTYGLIVITSDKGLAGAYNLNVVKEAVRILQTHGDCKLFAVGSYGRHYFEKRNIPIEKNFNFSSDNPTLDEARQIATEILEKYDRGELKKIFLIYTNLVNSFTTAPVSMRLLPFHRDYFDDQKHEEEKTIKNEFTFYPSLNAILEPMITSYIVGVIYGALVDSYTSEQNSRMNAMSSAISNAEDLLGKLEIQYNRLRQGQITEEIIEISAGAQAQKK